MKGIGSGVHRRGNPFSILAFPIRKWEAGGLDPFALTARPIPGGQPR